MAASILYVWLLISIMKRCAERCVLQLYQTSFRKEINRLLNKGMSNICYWEKLMFSKIVSQSILRSSNSRRYHWILKFLVATWISEFWEQSHVWLFYYFNFERNYDILKSKSPCILLNKKINFNKNEAESKMENPTHSFKETNLVLQLM